MATATAPGPKFKRPQDKAWALAEVARLDRLGYRQTEIAKALGLSQPSVSVWMTKVEAAYAESAKADRKHKVEEMVALVRDIRREAHEGLERSKLDKESLTLETTPAKMPVMNRRGETVMQAIERLKRTVTKEGRLPAAVYMEVILKTISMECELYGISAEKAPQGGDLHLHFDWSPFQERQQVEDIVEHEVKVLPAPHNGEVVDGAAET